MDFDAVNGANSNGILRKIHGRKKIQPPAPLGDSVPGLLINDTALICLVSASIMSIYTWTAVFQNMTNI